MSFSNMTESSGTKTVEFFSQIECVFKLQQQLEDHKRKWSIFKNGYYFDMAIGVATLILKNAQFNVESIKVDGKSLPNATIQFTSKNSFQFKLVQLEQEKTSQKPEASFTEVLPRMSKLIENILCITDDTTKTPEKSKDQVMDYMMDLVAFAREKNLVDFDKFKPKIGSWQHTRLIKSLDAIT
ncbi:MAG: hypothetical protein OXC46_07095 [Thaumarchaeota archaeon]|nr:hypothetical protein [Nitrososphaerota archaeon]